MCLNTLDINWIRNLCLIIGRITLSASSISCGLRLNLFLLKDCSIGMFSHEYVFNFLIKDFSILCEKLRNITLKSITLSASSISCGLRLNVFFLKDCSIGMFIHEYVFNFLIKDVSILCEKLRNITLKSIIVFVL